MNEPVTPRRSYLFALVDGGGTVPPELGVAQRLVDRGHDVTVLAEDSMRDDTEAAGARFRPWTQAPNRPSRLAEDDPYRDWECKNPLELVGTVGRPSPVGYWTTSSACMPWTMWGGPPSTCGGPSGPDSSMRAAGSAPVGMKQTSA